MAATSLARRWRWRRSSTWTSSPASRHGTRIWSTPLAKTMAEVMETKGPISIAAYMRQCLTSPQGGYYTTRPQDRAGNSSDQFGRKGDFTTSPEISQVFGELVAVWLVTEWMAQTQTPESGHGTSGKSKNVQLIEVGPGRGTLMADVLRTVAEFKAFAACVEGIHLVEASEPLREAQRKALCGEAGRLTRTEHGWKGETKSFGRGTLPVVWVEDVSLLPKPEQGKMPLIVAHEFFDALPIHAFEAVSAAATGHDGDGDGQESGLVDPTGKRLRAPSTTAQPATSTQAQWRELLVSPTGDPGPPHRRASPILTQQGVERQSARPDQPPAADFQLTRAKSATPVSRLLTGSSPRYRSLQSQAGSTIEISAECQRHASDFAQRIGKTGTGTKTTTTSSSSSSSSSSSGAALIIDYGTTTTIPTGSLRAIRSHRRLASPFTLAGQADLSADVDFTALADAAAHADPAVEIWGPVRQADFLVAMGGRERVDVLVAAVDGRDPGGGVGKKKEKEAEIRAGWARLVDVGSAAGAAMGRIYKVLAIVPENGGRRAPVGFGGAVVGASSS